MITPGLENLILSGKARHKSVNCVYGTIYDLPVRPLTWIVITDFVFFGFHENGVSPKGNTITVNDSINHLIRFDSNSGQYDYVHRTDQVSWQDREGRPKYDSFGHTNYNCYQIHNTNVRVLILRIPNVHQTIFNMAALPRVANEPNNPIGVGADAVVFSARLVPGGTDVGFYFPNAPRHPVNPLPPTFKNTFGMNVDPETELLQPFDNDVKSFPMVQISYVEIRGEMPDGLKGSK